LYFFHDSSTTEIYPLSLHDALPISRRSAPTKLSARAVGLMNSSNTAPSLLKPVVFRLAILLAMMSSSRPSATWPDSPTRSAFCRSEEHTSELQSRGHLVCRLLLEKK